MELDTPEKNLNFLKSIEFELSARIADYGITKAYEISFYRSEVMPYVEEWFNRRAAFLIRGSSFSNRLQAFREEMEREFADWSPKIEIKSSYSVPSFATEMIKEGWIPNER